MNVRLHRIAWSPNGEDVHTVYANITEEQAEEVAERLEFHTDDFEVELIERFVLSHAELITFLDEEGVAEVEWPAGTEA